MARIISFVLLVAILLVIAVLFFQVMAGFLLPMFLALLLAIVFRPVHQWFVTKCGPRRQLAAGLTTITILLIALTPLLVVLAQAVSESITFSQRVELREVNLQKLSESAVHAGNRIGLHLSAENVQKTITDKLQAWLYPVARGTSELLGQLFIGLIVVIVSLYYFLADGPEMIRTILRLAPLDDQYKQQLVEQFVNVSRAVVLATFLSAVSQGVLTGVGLYMTGLHPLFLMTVAATLLSMVPFVGPPAIWFTACLWLYFYEDRATAAIALGIYGTLIISTVDNIVKPWVLHGRSNLHPLLALLSVLGGVQALGVIGIFVGPMVVAFLQTLLNMVHTELQSMGKTDGKPAQRESTS